MLNSSLIKRPKGCTKKWSFEITKSQYKSYRIVRNILLRISLKRWRAFSLKYHRKKTRSNRHQSQLSIGYSLGSWEKCVLSSPLMTNSYKWHVDFLMSIRLYRSWSLKNLNYLGYHPWNKGKCLMGSPIICISSKTNKTN